MFAKADKLLTLTTSMTDRVKHLGIFLFTLYITFYIIKNFKVLMVEVSDAY